MFKHKAKKVKDFSNVEHDVKTQWVCPMCGTVNLLSEDFCHKCLEARKRKRDEVDNTVNKDFIDSIK